jgi:hypothetical protein
MKRFLFSLTTITMVANNITGERVFHGHDEYDFPSELGILTDYGVAVYLIFVCKSVTTQSLCNLHNPQLFTLFNFFNFF